MYIGYGDCMKIIIRNQEYKLIKNYRDCFDLAEITEKLNDVDYFDNYDYILGDYAYDKLRLKGFYKKENSEVKNINNYENIEKYIENYCSYGCKYYILEKEIVESKSSK